MASRFPGDVRFILWVALFALVGVVLWKGFEWLGLWQFLGQIF